MQNSDGVPIVEADWAEPDSLLGMIQRGRGAAYAAALGQRELAAEYVIGCIVDDPRWDHQVEQRGWLYATLVAELGMDLRLLRAAYARPVDASGDSDAWLAVRVFELLARRGVLGTVAELRRYLRTGRDFDLAFGTLVPFFEHPEAEGLLEEALGAADDEQLRRAIEWGQDSSAGPWPVWRRASARIDRVISDVERKRARPPTGPSGPATRDAAERERILRVAAESGLVQEISPAGITDEHWEGVLWDVAPAVVAEGAATPAVRVAVRRQLGRLRSPRALVWARAHADLDSSIGGAALSLLTDIGEKSDAPRLFDYLEAAHGGGNDYIYDQCSLVDVLARLDYVPAVPVVEAIFDSTVYSYLRIRCAEALSRLSAEFPRGRAVECLTDCEERTREIAIGHVDISVRAVRERLGLIAADPMEADDNRRVAATRIS
ncbi:hypothetical protein ACFXPS_24670 [Nocardia sp. NPDC059091]|uniref:hypothetical protein n=1 Tax=unclassified Nocardia TaxID=2637762 RepID=UPI00368D2808